MAIQKKIQLYVSDATGNQKTAKYYRISLPADNLPFDRETNLFKNMIHFYCTISGDSATFGAIAFSERVLEFYSHLASYDGDFTNSSALANYNAITPVIPEKLLNDGELSFDVHGIDETFRYISTDGYQHGGNQMLFGYTLNSFDVYINKITKKSGIFTSNNVIRSNSENELSQFIPSTWQEFDSMDDLLNDVRQRINDYKTMDRGDFGTYDEIVDENNQKFNVYNIFSYKTGQNTHNYININLSNNEGIEGTQLVTGCTGTQQILELCEFPYNMTTDLMLDTTNLVDEIAVISCDQYGQNRHTVKYQPNSGIFRFQDPNQYGYAIVFKNKADSANIKLTFVKKINPMEKLATLAANEASSVNELTEAFQNVPNSTLVETGSAMPPRMTTTDVPINDFYKVNNNENIRYLDVNNSSVTIKSTPGTKYKLFAKSTNGSVDNVPVDNTSGEVTFDLYNYTHGPIGSRLADLYLVKYEPTDIKVSW